MASWGGLETGWPPWLVTGWRPWLAAGWPPAILTRPGPSAGPIKGPGKPGATRQQDAILSAWRFAPPNHQRGLNPAQADYQSAAGCHPTPQCGPDSPGP